MVSGRTVCPCCGEPISVPVERTWVDKHGAAEILGVHWQTVLNYRRRGILKGRDFGGSVRFSVEELTAR